MPPPCPQLPQQPPPATLQIRPSGTDLRYTADVVTEHHATVPSFAPATSATMPASACRAPPPPRTHRCHHAMPGFAVAGRAAPPVLRQSKLPPSHGLRAPPSAAESASPAAAPPGAAHAVATEAGRSSFPVAGRLRRAGSVGELDPASPHAGEPAAAASTPPPTSPPTPTPPLQPLPHRRLLHPATDSSTPPPSSPRQPAGQAGVAVFAPQTMSALVLAPL
ncbi:uncharacterized protein LOC127765045 [Oryza glaberrima]|uniref:uncharacterized protein LOC127765045 n=1 Tax=Oryza glaberrima TaxID=4538 RepID=UPI00224C5F06|nr:uncharacterized protein LOC127765045 [Oryza glaberrima]